MSQGKPVAFDHSAEATERQYQAFRAARPTAGLWSASFGQWDSLFALLRQLRAREGFGDTRDQPNDAPCAAADKPSA